MNSGNTVKNNQLELGLLAEFVGIYRICFGQNLNVEDIHAIPIMWYLMTFANGLNSTFAWIKVHSNATVEHANYVMSISVQLDVI